MGKSDAILEIPATVTERGQTTVPAAMRKMLGLDRSGRVVFRALADGTVTLARAGSPEPDDDPVLGRFLDFLAREMDRPQGLLPVPVALSERAAALTEGIEVDLDQPLPPDDA
ncbi:regulator [Methylobacterium sp. Leaf456]|uniref:type II toxin-antitoxin system PrlF family antitoxin n=1 Tax=Methylobacterium sp. Leaf456 TaxID=1736382 RepID=UPI0006F786C1|nr:type II toxin-antitoxin system PrlF family antitoxin [Methylobacterium sp. Leaf456]KQT46488.1 regulator [Methylobacterium sp. Leaf456]